MIDRYTFPFDESGQETLTFGQALSAARHLSEKISATLGLWRWEEIGLNVIRRSKTYATYERSQFGQPVGEIVIFP